MKHLQNKSDDILKNIKNLNPRKAKDKEQIQLLQSQRSALMTSPIIDKRDVLYRKTSNKIFLN